MNSLRIATLVSVMIGLTGCAAMGTRVDPVNKAEVKVDDRTPRSFLVGKRPHMVYFSSQENKAAFDAAPASYVGFGY